METKCVYLYQYKTKKYLRAPRAEHVRYFVQIAVKVRIEQTQLRRKEVPAAQLRL